MCVASRRYLANFLFPPFSTALFYLWTLHDSPCDLTPSIGERQFAAKVTGQFTNYRSVNLRANEDYRRIERRRDTEGCQGRTPGTTITITVIKTITATTTSTSTTLYRSPGEYGQSRDYRRSHWKMLSLPSHPHEDRATLCHIVQRGPRVTAAQYKTRILHNVNRVAAPTPSPASAR